MNYTVRSELHNADENDYEHLHAAMEQQGFVRWIRDKEGVRYRLPTAEYSLLGKDIDLQSVLKRAQAAANASKPRPIPWGFVTAADSRTWSGLEEWAN